MGSSDFSNFAAGADPNKAFADAVEQAAHEYGHGGYTGSLAEKGSYVIITRNPLSMPEAYALAEKLIGEEDERIRDKWGPAGAIPVITGQRTIQVEVPSGLANDWNIDGRIATATALCKERKLLRRGEFVAEARLFRYSTFDSDRSRNPRFTKGSAQITIQSSDAPTQRTVTASITHDGKVGWENQKDWQAKAAAKVKLGEHEKITGYRVKEATPQARVVVESNSKIKAVTRYMISGLPQTYDTQAQARAAAVAHAEHPHTQSNTFEVIGVVRREGGLPLVKVTREIKKTVATIEMTVLKAPPVPPNTAPDGWLFFGWASS